MSECPVFHITGVPPAAVIASGSACEHFTSKMIGCPLPVRARTSRAYRIRRWSPQMIVPCVVHEADAIGVAVERDAQVRALAPDGRDQVLEVLGDRRIGMVVRERAVALREQVA